MDLALFYFVLLGFAILMYVILDGFDLGIGILYPWFQDEHDKDTLMRSISHVWDGNETWLVFGGVILFGAFPQAYADITSGLYLPIMLMLIGLIFRGVAFEYRFKSHTSKRWWNRAFALGSLVAAACQGLMLGALLQGLANPQHSSLTLVTPFTLFTAFALVAGYGLLGCSYLVLKTKAHLQQRAAVLGMRLLLFVLLALAVVSLQILWFSEQAYQRWLTASFWPWLVTLPLISGVAGMSLWRSLQQVQHGQNAGHISPWPVEDRPFWLACLIFVCSFMGLVVSVFPDLVPGHLSYQQAAAPHVSLEFMLPGVLIFVPLILTYTCWGYRIFAGKVEDFEEGY